MSTRSSEGIKVHRHERCLFLSHRDAEHKTNSIPMHHVARGQRHLDISLQWCNHTIHTMHQVDLQHYWLIRYYNNDCTKKMPMWEWLCGMLPQCTRGWGRSSSWQDHPVGQGKITARIRAMWKGGGGGRATQCCCCSTYEDFCY